MSFLYFHSMSLLKFLRNTFYSTVHCTLLFVLAEFNNCTYYEIYIFTTSCSSSVSFYAFLYCIIKIMSPSLPLSDGHIFILLTCMGLPPCNVGFEAYWRTTAVTSENVCWKDSLKDLLALKRGFEHCIPAWLDRLMLVSSVSLPSALFYAWIPFGRTLSSTYRTSTFILPSSSLRCSIS